MNFRFYYEIATGSKKYIDIESDSFRAARNVFFDKTKHLTFCKINVIANITNGGYNIFYKDGKIVI